VQQRGFGTVFDTPIAVRRSWIESYLTLGKELESEISWSRLNGSFMLPIATMTFWKPL
jgi:hypothetical protein